MLIIDASNTAIAAPINPKKWIRMMQKVMLVAKKIIEKYNINLVFFLYTSAKLKNWEREDKTALNAAIGTILYEL